MPTKVNTAKYSLREIWLYTYKMYRNRFDFKDRDVLKSIQVREIKVYNKDRIDMPTKRYEIRTSSYPQYKPYINVKGKKSKTQRKIKHQYDCTFQFNTLNWNEPFKWRIGSQKKWPDEKNINFNQVKAIHSSIRKKLVKKYGKGTLEYKKAVKKHKERAKYIDIGDYISQEYGLNGDFYFRNMGNCYLSGNLYGLAWNKDKYENGMPFFGKHDLRVVEYLLTKQIIKKTKTVLY